MLRKIAIGLVVLLAVFAGIVALRPAEFHIARTTTVSAPPAVPFAEVNDFRRWQGWSPYEGRDPAMQRTFSGAPAGEGAVYGWSGNDEVGEGRSNILASRPSEIIHIRLEFVRPFEATNTATFLFEPAGDETRVTWALDGRNGFMAKAIGLFVDFDRLVGADFEQGLARLKMVSERTARR